MHSNLCDKQFKKILKRKMAQGRVPYPTITWYFDLTIQWMYVFFRVGVKISNQRM